MTSSAKLRNTVRITLFGTGALLVAIQLVPYGRDHSNPPIVVEPKWDRPSTRELAARACFDCHSNETQWPSYSNVAPTSWLVQSHVDEARRLLNFSEWQRTYKKADKAAKELQEGDMPLTSYLLLHPRARLSPEEHRTLVEGLTATLGARGEQGD